jgi:hypothetical protein
MSSTAIMTDNTHLRLYIFGDQAYNVPKKDLWQFLQEYRPESPLIEFFRQSEVALEAEIVRNFRHGGQEVQQVWCGTSASSPKFLDLLMRWRGGSETSGDDVRHCLPLDMALFCMYQIAIYMRYARLFISMHCLSCTQEEQQI